MKEVDAEADETAAPDTQENQDTDGGNPDGEILLGRETTVIKMSKNSEARASGVPVPGSGDAIAYPI